MVATNNLGSRLSLKVQGGGDLTQTLSANLKKGENVIKLTDLGRNVTAADIDVLEGANISLQSVNVQGKIKKTATITIEAANAGVQQIRINVRLPQGAAQISHRLLLSNGAGAEFASYLGAQAGGTPVKGAALTVIAGETRGRPAHAFAASRSADFGGAALESVTSEVSANVYRIDLKKPVTLGATDQPKLINLYGKDLQVGNVDTVLTFAGQGGNTWGRTAIKSNAGDVNVRWETENSKENGLGLIVPGGQVSVRTADGVEVAATRIGDTSVDKKLVFSGGSAFDVDTTRLQLSFDNVGAVRTVGEGQNAQKFQTVRVTQEITIANKGDTDRTVQFSDRLPGSADDTKPAKVLGVAVNGVALDKSKWSVNAENGTLDIANVPVKGKGAGTVSYTVETVNQTA